MSIWKIVFKNIIRRRLSSTLTAASIALGVAVVVSVLALREQSREGFSQSAFGYELVVGPKGSALQLVLNTVYHMDDAQGTVAWSRYKELAAHRGVAQAVPMSVGDSYKGARVVGTTEAFFSTLGFAIEGRPFAYNSGQMEHTMAGHGGGHDHGGVFEAVVGSAAARKTGLGIGDRFQVSHGVEEGAGSHAEQWTVTGILKPTSTPNDRAIFINLDSFHAIKDHKQAPQISAVVVKTRSGGAQLQLAYDLNQLPDVMAVAPAKVMLEFFDKFDWVPMMLLAVSLLVVVMAAVSIFVAIYNSMAERRRAIAIMRALGARRTTVFSIILLEAMTLCFLGGVAGLLLGHLLTAAAGGALSARSGVSVSAFVFHVHELVVLLGVVLLGLAAGILPAERAYRTDIADGLSPTS